MESLIIRNLNYIMPEIIPKLDLVSLSRLMRVNKHFRDLIGLSPAWRTVINPHRAYSKNNQYQINVVILWAEHDKTLEKLIDIFQTGLFNFGFPEKYYHGFAYKLRFISDTWIRDSINIQAYMNLTKEQNLYLKKLIETNENAYYKMFDNFTMYIHDKNCDLCTELNTLSFWPDKNPTSFVRIISNLDENFKYIREILINKKIDHKYFKLLSFSILKNYYFKKPESGKVPKELRKFVKLFKKEYY